MKDSPERQALEDALKNEKAGSAKIRALAHYVKLKQAEYEIKNRKGIQINDPEFDYWHRQKYMLELMIEHQCFTQDEYEYTEAFKNAEAIFVPYLAIPDNPYQVLLDDLREINRGKSRK